jgi:hypothetical protein
VGLTKKVSRDFVAVNERDSHKPQISGKTSTLAGNKRNRMAGQGASLVEILLVP